MKQRIIVIGSPAQGAAMAAADRQFAGKSFKIGKHNVSYEDLKKYGMQADSAIKSGMTGTDILKGATGAALNTAIPGLGSVLPMDSLVPLWEKGFGINTNKPLGKYSMGDAMFILESIFTGKGFAALGEAWTNAFRMIGLAPPRNIKDANFVNQYGPHLYVPTKFNKPLIGSVGNFPGWFTGGMVTPLNSPLLALTELNTNLVPQDKSWEWVISHSCYETIQELEAGYLRGEMFKRNVPYGDAGNLDTWFTFMAMPKSDANYSSVYKPKTEYWLRWLHNLNGQPNPALTAPADQYTFTPDVEPAWWWAQFVRDKNPTYWTDWLSKTLDQMGDNLITAMQKNGYDPNKPKANTTVVPPNTTVTAPPARTPAAAPKETTGAIPLAVGVGALLYFLNRK